jgi:hypothetical protein
LVSNNFSGHFFSAPFGRILVQNRPLFSSAARIFCVLRQKFLPVGNTEPRYLQNAYNHIQFFSMDEESPTFNYPKPLKAVNVIGLVDKMGMVYLPAGSTHRLNTVFMQIYRKMSKRHKSGCDKILVRQPANICIPRKMIQLPFVFR